MAMAAVVVAGADSVGGDGDDATGGTSSVSGLSLPAPSSAGASPEVKGHQKDISGRGDDGSPSG